MKTAKAASKKMLTAAKPRRAGVPVRSGVKAGLGGTDRDPRQRMTSPYDSPFGRLG